MPLPYKKRLIGEIEKIPEDKMPAVYRVFHIIVAELIAGGGKRGHRGSLKGIWKGSRIDDSLFGEARKSLFPYEHT